MPMPNPRPTGFPSFDAPQGNQYEALFAPTSGHTLASPVVSGPASIVSGQNVWVRFGALTPRWNISRQSVVNPIVTNGRDDASTTSTVNGAMLYQGITANGPFVVAGTSAAGLWLGTMNGSSNLSFSVLSYTSSTGTSRPPSALLSGAMWFGATVYSAATDQNILVMSAGTCLNYCYAHQPTVTPPVFSHVTGSPGSRDVTTFKNRTVAWNCGTIADTTPIYVRCQWSVAGDPFDWTGIGSGFEDLVDMQGVGTRIFTQDDELVIASDREIWRGRYVGDPYVFQFFPLDRTQGIPYPRAALQTRDGIFWLGLDRNIYRLAGGQITAIGAIIQPLLLREMLINTGAGVIGDGYYGPFFTYNESLRQLRLWFAATGNTFPNRSITFDLGTGAWFREQYSNLNVTYGLSAGFPNIGNYAGSSNAPLASELLFTSAETACLFQESATSDLGSVVTQDVLFGACFPEDTRFKKTVKEVRLDLLADSAVSLGISISPTLGSGYSETKTVTLSASSQYAQSSLTFDTESVYPSVRLQSNGSARWYLPRMYVMAERQGR